MMNFLSKYKEYIFALMRMIIGFLFFFHGIQKIGFFAEGTIPLSNTLFVLAAIIETIAGFLITVGWQTGWAAFIASGEMAVAYFKSHQPKGLLPINNKGELAVLYCFIFLFIAAYGSGIWSIDNMLLKKRK